MAAGPNPIQNRPINGVALFWAEVLDVPSDGMECDMTRAQSNAVMKIMFATEKDLKLGIPAILGYSQRQGASLHRVPPWQHPRYGMLYATRISGMQGRQYVGPIASKSGNINEYGFLTVQVNFSTLPYDVLSDQQIGGIDQGNRPPEARRFTEDNFETITKWLTTERGQMQFDDPAAPDNRVFKQGTTFLVSEGMLRLKWYDVDRRYVLDARGMPANINKCVGYMNDDVFFGFKAKTLLMEAPRVTRHTMPVNPEVFFGGQATSAATAVDVEMFFRYLEPPTDSVVGYGHELAPHPNSPTGKWYRIRTVVAPPLAATATKTLYQATSYNAIFAAT